jgi:hypothetical protein
MQALFHPRRSVVSALFHDNGVICGRIVIAGAQKI